LWAGTLLCNKKKSQEQNAAGQTCWMRIRIWTIIPLYNSAFTLFSLWYEFFMHYILERWKKLSTYSWCGTFRILASSAKGISHQPNQNSVVLFWGQRQNSRSHLS
jgi:hypothetical protein